MGFPLVQIHSLNASKSYEDFEEQHSPITLSSMLCLISICILPNPTERPRHEVIQNFLASDHSCIAGFY